MSKKVYIFLVHDIINNLTLHIERQMLHQEE